MNGYLALIQVPSGAVPAVRAFWDLNRQIFDMKRAVGEDWRSAAQRAAQQLRACGSASYRGRDVGAAQAPALAHRGEAGEATLEERKVAALEAIADAARLWAVSEQTCSVALATKTSLKQLNRPEMDGEQEDEDVD